MTIVEALRDRRLFGALPRFRDLTTWAAGWLVFLKAFYGLPLDGAAEREAFRKHTGRSEPRPGGYPEAVAIVGRQSGKSAIAALVCAFEAAMSRDRGAFALLVAQDERAVRRTLFAYAAEPFREVPAFRREIARETADTLELASGGSLACYPCRPAAVRGVRAAVVAVDELAFFTATDGRPTDREMLRALRPCLATTGGRLLILSSPYGQSGALWDLHRAHFGRDDSATLVWQASAPEMNPTLPADYLKRMAEDDPEAYRSEVLGEFRSGVASLFDPEALDAVVVPGRREQPPSAGLFRKAFTDTASGARAGADRWTVGIGHRALERVVVDVVRAWAPPFNPSSVAAEAAELLKSYGCFEVVGDRYAGEFPRELFRSHGITYIPAEKDKSALYVELLSVVNSAGLELPDLPELLRELRGLERRRGASGRDRVDHRPGAHDDLANAVAGLVSLLPAGDAVACGPVGLRRDGSESEGDDDGGDRVGAVADPGGFLSQDSRERKRGWRF